MTKASLPLGLLIVLFILIFGLVTYFLIVSIATTRKNQKLIKIYERQLLDSIKRIEEKRVKLEELSKKIRKAGRKLDQISEVKRLKTELIEEHKKNHELEIEVKRLKHNSTIKIDTGPVEKATTLIPKPDDNETRKIKQRYPALPKNQLERIEIERSIARSLMKNNGGSFHISQILKSIEDLYSRHVKPNDRIMLLNEIKNWLERDPLCKIVKITGEIQHYTFI